MRLVYHFDVVSFNSDLLFSTGGRHEVPLSHIIAHPEMLKFPIAVGQCYVLLHGTTIMDNFRDIGHCLDHTCQNRITVVRQNRKHTIQWCHGTIVETTPSHYGRTMVTEP